MEKIIPIPAYVNGIRTLADGSWRLTLDTQELSEEGIKELTKKLRKHGFLIFLENAENVDLDGLDIPEAAPEFHGDKTPGQRLRAVLYVLWENIGSQGTFQDFYVGRMEEFINQVKKKLP